MLNIFGTMRSQAMKINRSFSSDTIFALSSGHGKCGVAVIRVSGKNSCTALKLMTNSNVLPKARSAILRRIKHPISNETLDRGLILWFPGPSSFTGEDSFELQVHGGLAVVNAVLNALGSIPNMRLAEPGEFTRRAFHNAKLDLTEVEGLADLLQAETELQRRQAYLQTEGSLSKLYNSWKKTLTNGVARVEAYIDFDETETLDYHLMESVTKDIQILAKDIGQHLADGRKGEILRNGVKTVILGEPNVGKSSLLNLLCERPAAIVTPIEGTTRDILEVTLNIHGYPLVLADTAGLRSSTEDIIEREGIERALKLYERSNFVILVVDIEKYGKWKTKHDGNGINDYLREYVKELKISSLLDASNERILFNKQCLVVFNKSDLLGQDKTAFSNAEHFVCISCKTEEGVTELVHMISQKLKILCGDPSDEYPSMNQLRHRQHLSDCQQSLQLFLDISSVETDEYDLVIMAEYLRKALRHLGKLVGNVTTDQLLDVIFRDFCIGK